MQYIISTCGEFRFNFKTRVLSLWNTLAISWRSGYFMGVYLCQWFI